MKTIKFISTFLCLSWGVVSAQELTLKVSEKPINLKIGQSIQLQAAVVDDQGNKVEDREYLYFSRDRRALSVVDTTGLATAIKHGEYSIVVISPNKDKGRLRADIQVIIEPEAIAKVEVAEVPGEIYAGVIIPLSITVIDEANFERP
ncbi:MAG: hypothetical protein AAGF85_13085 [Bacteroidota bacterium]